MQNYVMSFQLEFFSAMCTIINAGRPGRNINMLRKLCYILNSVSLLVKTSWQSIGFVIVQIPFKSFVYQITFSTDRHYLFQVLTNGSKCDGLFIKIKVKDIILTTLAIDYISRLQS